MKLHRLLLSAVLTGALGFGAVPKQVNAQSTSVINWATIVDNGDTMPDSSSLFNSYNQPSINANGLVVFRARSKGGGGQPVKGIYERNPLRKNSPIVKILDATSVVPQPNNLDATFNEFPSIPRIGVQTGLIATRGESSPVWEYTLNGVDTRVGTSGIYLNTGLNSAPLTGMSQLGPIPEFSYWQVPNAPAGTKFDQFPGAPSPTNGRLVVFKGNWTDANAVSQTGVYYRDVIGKQGTLPVQFVADTSTVIPNQPSGGTVTFGSTAPPSAVGLQMVFVGLDNEDAPTLGGIYLAKIKPNPPLTTLIGIGDPVPGVPNETFNMIGEGLSFTGRYVSFWGAWGTNTRNITLYCPTDGNADLIAYCNATYPNGFQTTEPVNQGIFVTDVLTRKTVMVAQTGQDNYYNFIYWVYSGRPPGTGGGDTDDFEPARWRFSAFTALTANGSSYRAAFKATKDDQVTQGIYLASGPNPSLTSHLTVVDTNTDGSTIDPVVSTLGSLTPLTVTSVGVERDGFRNRRLALSIGMSNLDASVSWAGLYVAKNPH
jgi:hypothetical protein